jgi:predicted nucleic acid-binding protein
VPIVTGIIEVKVTDASAIAAILFDEPEGEAVATRLGTARLAAPAILSFELANVCLTKCRRHPDRRDLLVSWFRSRHRLPVHEIAIDTDAVLGLAMETNLTFYDASYLWLARRLDAELVTLDKTLARAAAR